MDVVNNNDTLLGFGNLLLGLAIIPSIAFLIVYMSTAKWWKAAIGRMYVLGQAGIVVVSLVVLLSLWFGADYPGRDWIRILGYGLHLIGQIVFFTTYLKERRDPESRLPKTRQDQASIDA